MVRRELCAKVAPAFVGIAHPRDEVCEDLVVEASRRNHDALVSSVRESAGMLPGSEPPTSAWCARVTAKPTSVRETSVMSGRCVPPAYGSLRTKTSSGCGLLGQRRRNRVGHRAEVDGNVLGLGDDPAAFVEEGGGAVAPLLDVGREGGADEDGAHLLGDRAERAAENLELNVHVRVSLQVAPSLAPTHPGGSQQVDPSSSSTAGPAISSRADLLGSMARARADLRRADGDELDRTVPVERAVPLLVRPVEGSARSPPSGTVSSKDCPV